MAIKKTDEDYFIIKIPRKLYTKELQQMLGFVEHLKVVSKSKATDDGIEKLLNGLKKQRTKKVQSFLKERGVIS